MFIKAYVHDILKDEFTQISLDDSEICVIFEPQVFKDIKIIQPEYIERNNFVYNIIRPKEITMFYVILRNGQKFFVCQEDLDYVGDGVYERKGV